MHGLWLVACVVIAMLAGCDRPAGDDAQPSAARNAAATEKKARALERNAVTGEDAAPFPIELIGKNEVQAVDPHGKERLDDAITCLARTIYWEARGETAASMEAVASVVMNRLGHEGFPKTVCAVVRQGGEQGSCQFSWWCDGRPDQAKEDEPYATAKEIARRALNQQLRDRTDGALYFHHRHVTPGWSATYLRTAEIGDFVFYTPRGDSAR